MKKRFLIVGIGLFLIALTGCAQQASNGSEVIGVTPEDFAAACEEGGYTASEGSADGAQAAPSMSSLSGIKIGRGVTVTVQASSCSSLCNICRCSGTEKEPTDCYCQD